jgi:hypothetical protein
MAKKNSKKDSKSKVFKTKKPTDQEIYLISLNYTPEQIKRIIKKTDRQSLRYLKQLNMSDDQRKEMYKNQNDKRRNNLSGEKRKEMNRTQNDKRRNNLSDEQRKEMNRTQNDKRRNNLSDEQRLEQNIARRVNQLTPEQCQRLNSNKKERRDMSKLNQHNLILESCFANSDTDSGTNSDTDNELEENVNDQVRLHLYFYFRLN